MRSRTLAVCLVVLALSAATLLGSRPAHSTISPPGRAAQAVQSLQPAQCNNPAAKIPLMGATCGTAPDLQLSCYLPSDIQITATNFNQNQRQADIFSWQEFISLNWPARDGARGVPDPSKPINASGPRVWETWKEEYEVYLPNGAPPAGWNAPEPVPATCGGGAKRLSRTQKIDDVIDSHLQAAAVTARFQPTLTDQQQHLVRYEIRMNKVMFDYIVQNRLYDARVQQNVQAIDFPDGGILVKAAWREVTPTEEGQYHTTTACVCEDKNGQPSNCRTKRMGLVGFHITQKTPNAPQWIWSTFEQVNNVPGPGAGAHPAFYNPQCPNCPVNRQTAVGTPNQMTRVTPISSANPDCNQPMQGIDNVQLLNVNVQAALKQQNAVLQYYQLVNTQWPVPPPTPTPTNSPTTVFTVQPATLANTTMESFVQATSTCMGCHAMARTVGMVGRPTNATGFVSSDFSFTLNNAKPGLTDPFVIPPPATPVTQWDVKNWQVITQGYEYATRTYERLPKNVPTAKLHCSSCHLNAGGNMNAAWWANLQQEYPTTECLQNRINGCFERSLNGNALCTPNGFNTPGKPPSCGSTIYPGSKAMNALVIYMQWLTEQAQARKMNTSMHGFPPLPGTTPTGNLAQGQAVFRQKCAVCHRLDGAGRYENNLYYRPALWGAQSFNKSAGMFSDPIMLTEFIRWNMPLGSGGLLTDQEAADVAKYVDSQPRPSPIAKQSPTPDPCATPTPKTR